MNLVPGLTVLLLFLIIRLIINIVMTDVWLVCTLSRCIDKVLINCTV